VVEETPSVIVDDRLRSEMGKTAVDAARACGYINAGTIEFLVDSSKSFYFLEMNTRLQVEHPVTELRTGLDLVAEQIRIAEGHPIRLRQEDVRFSGHAIECRICAEDVENDFLPSTGSILHLRPPQGPGLREDRGVEEGGEIPVYYDSMISKLVAWAPTREEALNKMERGLMEYEILGVKTNIPLCLFVLRHPEFRAGAFDTHFLPRHFSGSERRKATDQERRAIALVCAILESRNHSAAQSKPVPGEDRSTAKGWLSKRSDELR
jgi:propionyl-CoA carboxylase alpha chain